MHLLLNKTRSVSLFSVMKDKNTVSLKTILLPRKYFRRSGCNHMKKKLSEYHRSNNMSEIRTS